MLTPSTLNPVTITKQVVGAALEVVDNALDITAEYAERGSHIALPVTNKTELECIDDDGGRHSIAAKLIDGVREQLKNGLPVENIFTEASAIIDALVASKTNGGQDDRKFLLEQLLIFLARYPEELPAKKKLTDKVITLLYNDLPHPPQAIVGRKHRYRSADGSGTSLWHKDMGKAGVPYARSVQGTHPLPANELPSPELVFDALLKREKVVEHPAGLSSHFFAFANLVIHQLFSTDHSPERDPQEPWNKTSSYLDLSILYGNSQSEQDNVRRNDGTGKIYNDCFADSRLARMPPSTGALAILFSRNHNYIAQKLLEINENKTFVNPPPTEEKAKKKQDDDLFNTARLVNSGFFMQTILADYLAAILGLVREGNSWALDPLTDFRNQDHRHVFELVSVHLLRSNKTRINSVSERGTGNVVSIEFTALYHFHASISAKDEKWAEAMMRGLFRGENIQSWDDLTPEMYNNKIAELTKKAQDQKSNTDSNDKGKDSSTKPKQPYPVYGTKPRDNDPLRPAEWEIFWMEGIWRDEKTGKFKDADLAKILQDATEHPACAFGARGTPHVMRIIEWMAIEQNRAWGTCTLNAFRSFLGLRPYKTFEEWNPIPEVAEAARRLYGHPDNLELYPGLQAEEAKPVIPGAGLCASYTMTRAILADAVALVRGDRFLTTDFTSFNLTAWGYNDAIRNPKNSANGGTLAKLLMRTLPDFYPDNNTYTLFPLMTPAAMKKYLGPKFGALPYKWDRPVPLKSLKVIRDWPTARDALQNSCFNSDYPNRANSIFSRDRGYFQLMNDASAANAEIAFIREQFAGQSSLQKHRNYIFRETQSLIKSKSYSLVGDGKRSVDIVRDVLVNLPTRFVSDIVLGLPLKTEEHPRGTLFEHELSEKLKEIYNFIFLQNDPTTHLARTGSAKDTVGYLVQVTAQHWASILNILKLDFSVIKETTFQLVISGHIACHEWLRRLKNNAGGRSDQQLLNDAVSLAVLLGVEYSQLLIHCLDTFLPDYVSKNARASNTTNPDDAKARFEKIADAARQSQADSISQQKLRSYIIEALRLAPAIPGVYRNVVSDVKVGDKPFCRGDHVYISISEAQADEKPQKTSAADATKGTTWHPFPQASKPSEDTILLGDGLIKLLGQDYVVDVLLIPALRVILSLKDLSRVQGNSGRLK
ncbi:hypothetical protein FRC04_007172 [Tulasnella sp. 424]|nr:hypothetical protein FRC04_007172 [Tulasnella sp. 424]KAG8974609.1 hypothetical protein FRC05_007085 [Tulasnella sp. 425]